ncbi:Peroxiredoxin-2 [Hypsibius exemplaris]|uniref:thioredoxin-dependent peroxiredoxin n=1 Tax=Hypsibius exemplaris TaxID=2072580 RepID=A0A1W0WPY3_HYPEX|nr:Peroxiredoxin-2 [Hypsibius exemplaris]
MASRAIGGFARITTQLTKTSMGIANSHGRHLLTSFLPSHCAAAPALFRTSIYALSTQSDAANGVVLPRVQHRAPDFEGMAVVEGQFKSIKLSDYKGKYLILLFYPLDFTFVCPTEIIAFSDYAEKFRAINTEVVAVSTDSHFSHLAWTNLPRKEGGLGPMKIPLLADFNKKMSRNYGVLIEEDGIALRGMFLIDPKQVLRQITVNDLPVGRSVDEALRLVQAFQFVEEHGEVCPAGWTPKSDTIKPDPTKAKEYFRKVAEKKH